MLDDKDQIVITGKDGNPINITVDVPPDPQPQMISETFEYHKLYGKDNKPNNNDE